MIRQRNLSLLANRPLKEHRGPLFTEAVLERDYCLTWYQAGLSQSARRELLVFNGGVALKS